MYELKCGEVVISSAVNLRAAYIRLPEIFEERLPKLRHELRKIAVLRKDDRDRMVLVTYLLAAIQHAELRGNTPAGKLALKGVRRLIDLDETFTWTLLRAGRFCAIRIDSRATGLATKKCLSDRYTSMLMADEVQRDLLGFAASSKAISIRGFKSLLYFPFDAADWAYALGKKESSE